MTPMHPDLNRRKCFECDKPAQQRHHVVPKSVGGKRTIPLCETCHGLVHSRNLTEMARLRREGVARARAEGVRFGRPVDEDAPEPAYVKHLRTMGRSWAQIAAQCKCTVAAARRAAER